MLPRDEIAMAVDIQKRSYKLLCWVGDAVDQGFISFSRAHNYASAAEAALDWIDEHYDNIPVAARPGRDQLQPFSNYFGSYVTTSFDLVQDRGKRRVDPCGCNCELCSYLVDVPCLQAMKPSKLDKNRAMKECISRVEMLAQEEGLPVTPEQAKMLVSNNQRAAAYSAYGLSILNRIKGSEGGLYILALWRMIAWKPEGSPIKGFELTSEDIFNAEHELVSEIAQFGDA